MTFFHFRVNSPYTALLGFISIYQFTEMKQYIPNKNTLSRLLAFFLLSVKIRWNVGGLPPLSTNLNTNTDSLVNDLTNLRVQFGILRSDN